MELIILVGLQALGKSYFYNSRFAMTHVHISKDLMRNAKDRNTRQLAFIEDALKKGKSVVVDNTNPGVADRAPLIQLGRKYGARIIAYYFDAPVKTSVERNRKRAGKARVPDVAIYVTSKRLRKPELDEGIDQIITVTV